LTTTETFDESNPAAGWTPAPPLNTGRAHHNTVLLPDGSMVTVGGGYGILNGDRRSGDPAVHRNIELWDPATGQWRIGPAQDELRTYHSTALLLPDGRVLSAGDDGYGGSSNDTAEIYSPPYLFRGARPTIASAPGSVDYGESFTVGASDDATSAVLMGPGAVTHANDMDQRYVAVNTAVGANGQLTVTAPPSPVLAPPTYYMLFVLNDAGVPSVARFIRLKPGRDDTPPPPPDTSITAHPPSQSDTAEATFEFESDMAGASFRCKLDAEDPVGCSSPTVYEALGEGSHTFEVAAIGPGGAADPTPATWSWNVDTEPDTLITSGPAAQTQSTSATFHFESTQPGSTFTCALDAATPAACSSPVSFTDLGVGSHSFSVTATDAGGKSDPSPATSTWMVEGTASDTTDPETSITAGPPVASQSTAATFELASNEPGSAFACKLDAGAWTACTTPVDHAGLSPGPHTFAVRAIDSAGNVDQSPAMWNWTVKQATQTVLADMGTTAPAIPMVAPDTTAPVVRVAVRKAQHLRIRAISLQVTCPLEPCTVTAEGRIVMPGSTAALRLGRRSTHIPAGSARRIELLISRKAMGRARRALRAEANVRARITLVARDAAGNASTTRRTMRLTR
jgi:hypothetical protein